MADGTATETDITPQRASELAESGALVIDVRRDYEFEAGHIAGARHIEMNDLTGTAESLPRDRPSSSTAAPGTARAWPRRPSERPDSTPTSTGARPGSRGLGSIRDGEVAEPSAGPRIARPDPPGHPARIAGPRDRQLSVWQASPPDPQDPIAGLRAWLAQLDRSLGVRTDIRSARSRCWDLRGGRRLAVRPLPDLAEAGRGLQGRRQRAEHAALDCVRAGGAGGRGQGQIARRPDLRAGDEGRRALGRPVQPPEELDTLKQQVASRTTPAAAKEGDRRGLRRISEASSRAPGPAAPYRERPAPARAPERAPAVVAGGPGAAGPCPAADARS